MHSVLISDSDPRSLRAIELCSSAGQWLRCRSHAGEVLYGIPSQRQPGRYHLASASHCSCQDFRRHALSVRNIGHYGSHFLCKHNLAVRLLSILTSVEYVAAQPRLRVVK